MPFFTRTFHKPRSVVLRFRLRPASQNVPERYQP